ncbi:EthD family reductase [Pseudomonas sp. LRF_L74]|uniref:EthD family reductase n=1 Tax=Pseudomonas sp. LRF_L74 TaxID=3369422 RepID=UPI003F636104
MIKVSVFYPNGADVRFDIDYYCNTHMALVRDCLGSACKGIAVDHGLASEGGQGLQPFVAIGHLLFDSLEDFQGAFAPHGDRIMGDLPNFTNVQPQLQISDVRLTA